MASPPTGTLTFLFTDIEGPTKLWEHDAQAKQKALAQHDKVLGLAIEQIRNAIRTSEAGVGGSS